MDAIQTSIRHLRATIPGAILEAAFRDNTQIYQSTNSLEKNIYDKVIRGFVIPDLSNYGQIVDIRLEDLPYKETDTYIRRYVIPATHTEGRKLVSAHVAAAVLLRGAYGAAPVSAHNHAAGSAAMSAVGRLVNQNSPLPRSQTAKVKILSHNTVEIHDPGHFNVDMYLRCRIELKETLSEIKPPFYKQLHKLIEFAVKRFIYLELALALDVARLEYGQDYTRFKDFVEGYSDAAELYEEQLTVMGKCLVLNDDIGNELFRRNAGKSNV